MKASQLLSELLSGLESYLKRQEKTPTIIQPHKPRYTHRTINDTYEAAFYMTKGASIVEIKKSKVRENKRDKYGYREAWAFSMIDIPVIEMEAYHNGTAVCNVQDFKRERLRIKKFAKE